ncbi:substrate-binding periplasmic protein [Pseudomonas sp. S9]|uniref:substrate-binding periplasmic protein n=1 Tax=Pseudomonas sp. S9 TaxID=686578 RepID=UPI0002556FCB|nr:transporter substrate-binding domain-containing protein [Pseudomonas sp. S9]
MHPIFDRRTARGGFAVCLLLLATWSRAEQRPLNFSIPDSWGMPLVDLDNGQATRGFVFDLENRLADRVNRQARFIVVPRLRVSQSLLTGRVDVHCFVSKDWMQGNTAGYVWSEPFMEQPDVLIARATQSCKQPPPGTLIGAVHGYEYSALESDFANGRLVRDDARTQDQVFNKLAVKRYDYALSNEISVDWYNKDKGPEAQLQKLKQVGQSQLGCMVRNSPEIPTQEILATIARMNASDEIDQLLQAYR